MVNEDIRNAIKEANIKYWQIADKLGMNDGNFSRKLRHEMTEDEKLKILKIINENKGE